MSGCSALDALERDYEAVVRQKPITPIPLDAVPPRQKNPTDGEDGGEEGVDYDELQSICSYAATCDDDLERERLNSDDESEGYDYEPLREDEWVEADIDEEKPMDPATVKKSTSLEQAMNDNDKEAIQKAMKNITLRPPSWGANMTDEQLVHLVKEMTNSDAAESTLMKP